MKKEKITFKAHRDLINGMQSAIMNAGYGQRGKSRWMAEALDELFKTDDYWELVIEEKPTAQLERNPESVFIAPPLRGRLDEAIVECTKKEPFRQGMQSAIVRTAIIQRLLKEGVYPVNNLKILLSKQP